MFYFKAEMTIENGKKKYGSLPLNFTVGYEDDELGIVYFPSVRDLSNRYVDLTKLSKEEYEIALGELQSKLQSKKQTEIEETRTKIQAKKEENEQLRQTVEFLEVENADLWYEDIITKAKLNDAEQEIADLWYQVIVGGV